MRIILTGAGGTGKTTVNTIALHPECQIVAGVDKFADGANYSFPVYTDISKVGETADCLIDFSVKAALPGILTYITEKKLPAVLRKLLKPFLSYVRATCL